MKTLALLPIVAVVVVVAGLATGALPLKNTSHASPDVRAVAILVVDVNVADDPDGHAQFIELSDKLTLKIEIDPQNGDITIDSLDGTGWVPVSGAFEDGEIFATGSGKVANIQDIAVVFEGVFDVEGFGLSGQYRMGTDLGLPPDFLGDSHPIKYTIKARNVCPSSGAAGCPPTPTPSPTDFTKKAPDETPTPTLPLAAPTVTPTPTKTKALEEFTNPGSQAANTLTISGDFNMLTIIDGPPACSSDPTIEVAELVTIRWSEKCVQPGHSITVSVLSEDQEPDLNGIWSSAPPPLPTAQGEASIVVEKRMPLFGRDDIINSAPLPGWQISIYAGNTCQGSPVASGLTDLSGWFSSPTLAGGQYSVAETLQPAWEQIGPSCVKVVVAPGGSSHLTIFNWPVRNGDVNKDGMTDSRDSLVVLQIVAGFLDWTDVPDMAQRFGIGNSRRIDTTEDGQLDSRDATLILQFTAGFLSVLPVGSTPPTPTFTPTDTPTTPASTSTDTPAPAIPTDTPVPPTPNTTPAKREITLTNTLVNGASGVEAVVQATGGFDSVLFVESSNPDACDELPTIEQSQGPSEDPPGSTIRVEWGEINDLRPSTKCVKLGDTITLSVMTADAGISVQSQTWFNDTQKVKREFTLRNDQTGGATGVDIEFDADGFFNSVAFVASSNPPGCQNQPTLTRSAGTGEDDDDQGSHVRIEWGTLGDPDSDVDTKCVAAGDAIKLTVMTADPDISIDDEDWFNDTGSPTPSTGKVSITVDGGPSRPIKLYQGEDCMGIPTASVTINGSFSASFSPGDYSVLAEDVEGWELSEGIAGCQNIELDAGKKVFVEYVYQQTAGVAGMRIGPTIQSVWQRIAGLF